MDDIHQDVRVGLLPTSKPLVFDDLPVSPNLVHGDLPEVLGLVAVGSDEEVGEHLPAEILLHLETESEEVHEARQEVLGPSPGELQDVGVLPQLQLPGVDFLIKL